MGSWNEVYSLTESISKFRLVNHTMWKSIEQLSPIDPQQTSTLELLSSVSLCLPCELVCRVSGLVLLVTIQQLPNTHVMTSSCTLLVITCALYCVASGVPIQWNIHVGSFALLLLLQLPHRLFERSDTRLTALCLRSDEIDFCSEHVPK